MLQTLQKVASSFARRDTDGSDLTFFLSEDTDRSINDLIEDTKMTDRTELLKNAFRLYDALTEGVDESHKFYTRDKAGKLEPFLIGSGLVNENAEDRKMPLYMLMRDKSEQRLYKLVERGKCRDIDDVLVHAVNTFKNAVEMVDTEKMMVRELPDGTIEDYQVFCAD